jgi:hypothetical protein
VAVLGTLGAVHAGLPDLVGRDAEAGAIAAFLADPAPLPRALVLEGEARIGKTTLWRAGVERTRRGPLPRAGLRAQRSGGPAVVRRAARLAATGGLAATTVAAALFTADTPIAVIALVALLSGVARSVGLTGYSTLGFGDVPPEQMRDANALAATVQLDALRLHPTAGEALVASRSAGSSAR